MFEAIELFFVVPSRGNCWCYFLRSHSKIMWQYSYGTPVVIQACYKHTFMTRKILYPLKFLYLGKFFEILLKLSRKTTFRKFYEFQYTFDLLSCSIRPTKTIWALYLVNGSLLPNKSGMLSSKQFILK